MCVVTKGGGCTAWPAYAGGMTKRSDSRRATRGVGVLLGLVCTQELELVNEEANVYKLIGPVLVKQDLVEEKANVKKRMSTSPPSWIHILIGQHVALHDPDPHPGVISLINTKSSPIRVAQAASEDARAVCSRKYGSALDINIYGDSVFTFL
ncbi:hypothetical protein GUJ93_ZPchr0003g17537 [Zizania palustris]|uniref:Uncharacterized protein n=1 Tax=Zizania palustris TaxID=103762 RepID=A0A8J5S9V7_ZIZPA|nr:hypothetical protein GUJ93_ZPchr0003g17537 [Zizania palustris]